MSLSKQKKKLEDYKKKIFSNQSILAYNRLRENNRLRGSARTYSDPPTLFVHTRTRHRK